MHKLLAHFFVKTRCAARHPFSHAGTLLLHIALTTILVGACVTHFFGVTYLLGGLIKEAE